MGELGMPIWQSDQTGGIVDEISTIAGMKRDDMYLWLGWFRTNYDKLRSSSRSEPFRYGIKKDGSRANQDGHWDVSGRAERLDLHREKVRNQ
ncbi:MAG: hypothetical protein IM618_14200 [Cytophagales bacterium]|nr:hypothetical protein [Cytophagales bacterium]